jgi:eukaryotic-like serine/threonine-protein kinase
MSHASRVEALFFAALEKATADERAAYLNSACAGDAVLRRQVEKLLKAHPRLGDFLNQPVVERLTPTPTPDPSDATQVPDASTDGPGAAPAGRKGPTLARSEGGRPDEDSAIDFLQPSTRPDSLGRLGHYEILEVLGRGGFGVVFRAFDETLQRVVAVKALAPQLAVSSPPRKRFLREARSTAKVRHENVVQVYAVEEQPLPYLVMEFIPGETLQQRLDRTGPLDVPEVLQIGRQIAEGLAAAHGTGLVHRDIKPGNILIEAGPHQRVKITDFGLARAADDASLTQSGIVAGTPMFMAPEQANGEALDHRADLFSLGSVLYTMCTGRPPFRAKSALAVLKRVAEDTPRPIREVIPEVPQWLCDIISRLHAKKPEDRFASAQELAELLTRHLAQLQHPEYVPVPPVAAPSAVEKIPRFRARRWVAAAALMTVLGGLGFTEASGVTDIRGTVIRLMSPEGTLIVEVDDPGVSVKIDGSEIVITGAGVREIRLKPGRYSVEASKDGKLVRQELVTVTNKGRRVVRVSQEAPPDTKANKTAAAAWERSVAALPAAEQVKAVGDRLKELNPDFDEKVAPTIENGVVTGLAFSTDQVSDISPVRVLTQLRSLNCSGSDVGRGQLSDLSPLRGLPLTTLRCLYTSVSDLSPLKGMELTSLDCRHTKVGDADVKTLAGLKNLQTLSLWGTRVTDAGLKELTGLTNLQWLSLETTRVTDVGLKELAGLQRLEHLSLYNVGQVTDAGLEELAGLKALKSLDLRGTNVTDAGARKVAFALPSLRIQARDSVIEPRQSLDPDRRAAEYVLFIGGTVMVNGQGRQIRAVADLPREAFRLTQVGLSKNKLVRDAGLANFKGCKNLTEILLDHAKVSDLSPLSGLPLTHLDIGSTPVSDLSPLKGMKLIRLYCPFTNVSDLSPLTGMPLQQLYCGATRVTDLSPLKGMQLTTANFESTEVADLTPLRGMSLKNMSIGRQVTNLTPLKGMPLEELTCAFASRLSDLSPLKGMSLKLLNLDSTQVADLSPLKGMPLNNLGLPGTKATDLTALKDMITLRRLALGDLARLADLSPLIGLALEELHFSNFKADRDATILRAITTLKSINGKPAAAFWKEVDAKANKP